MVLYVFQSSLQSSVEFSSLQMQHVSYNGPFKSHFPKNLNVCLVVCVMDLVKQMTTKLRKLILSEQKKLFIPCINSLGTESRGLW